MKPLEPMYSPSSQNFSHRNGSSLADGLHAFLIHRLHLIVFDGFLGGTFLAHLLFHGGRRAGGGAAGHGEQEHGEDDRSHNVHGNSLKPPNGQRHVGEGDGFFEGELAGCLRSPMRSSSCNNS